jgi:hypothetical protein
MRRRPSCDRRPRNRRGLAKADDPASPRKHQPPAEASRPTSQSNPTASAFPIERKSRMNRYGLVIIAVAVALLAAAAWTPARQYAGFPSPVPSPSASPSPAPSPQEPTTDEQEPATQEPTGPTPEAPRPRFDKCIDGSALTVTGRDGNQTYYRCESGAVGSYLN